MSCFSCSHLLAFNSSVNSIANDRVDDIAGKVWKDKKIRNSQSEGLDNKVRSLLFDDQEFFEQIDGRGLSKSTGTQPASSIINLPLPSGEFIKLFATEYSIMEKGAKAFGDFRSWRVRGVDNPATTGVIDISSNGFHGMLFLAKGETILIEPVSGLVTESKLQQKGLIGSVGYKSVAQSQQKVSYQSYKKGDKEKPEVESGFRCGVGSTQDSLSLNQIKTAYKKPQKIKSANREGRTLKNYRMAMAATGEFSEYFIDRGLDPNLAIQSIMARVNAIYQRDLAINLQLVDNNSSLVFFNKFTDPYPFNNDASLLEKNTEVIDQMIGSGAYDIGHVLTRFRRSTGGVAILGSVCADERDHNQKGAGTTGSKNPNDPSFAIDFVAHELGHQLGATHTFNSVTGSCSGENRQADTAFEPGGGSSVMAYAGICGSNNIIDHSLSAFHIASIEQIDENVRDGEGTRCGEEISFSNSAPIITEITSNLTVNAGESFILFGSAVDDDGDSLTYSWDQVDAGSVSDKFIDTGDNALFRYLEPSESSEREFEGFALTNRELNFKLVVRDGNGAISSAETKVTVINGNESPTLGSSLSSNDSGGGAIDTLLLLFLSLTLMISNRAKFTPPYLNNDIKTSLHFLKEKK